MKNLKPQIFAPIGQFVTIACNANIGIALHGMYDKAYQSNQIQIASANGAQKLTMHLNRVTLKKTYMEVEFASDNKWRNELLRSIETAYRKAPFYEFYDYKVLPVLEYSNMGNAIKESYRLLCEILDLDTVIEWNANKTNMESNSAPIVYNQVFMPKNKFIANCSILDVLFNQGPMAADLIKNGTIAK